jgi:hypothetical protein
VPFGSVGNTTCSVYSDKKLEGKFMAKNIERFDTSVLFILEYLYDQFPKKNSFDSMIISKEKFDLIYGKGKLAPDGSLGFLNVLAETIVWLSDEGYIRYLSHKSPHQFNGVVLSEKGLNLLRKPSSINKAKAWIDVCKEEFRKGTKAGIQQVGKELFKKSITKMFLSDD